MVQVSSITEDGEYGVGDVIRIMVTMDEVVNVTGQPILLLGTGDTTRAARYSEGSGTRELVFEYTVRNGDSSSDLDVYSENALQLNGGTIQDLSGNSAALTTPSGSDNNSLASQAEIIVDAVAPDVTISSVSLAPEGSDDQLLTLSGSDFDRILGSGETSGLTLQGSDLSRFDWSKLSLGIQQADNSVENVTFEQSDIQAVRVFDDRLEIVIDEGADKITGNNGYSSANGEITLTTTEGFIGDSAGNASTTDAVSGTDVSVSTSGATVLGVTADTADGSYNAGDEIEIRVRFSEVVTLENYTTVNNNNNNPLLLLLNDRAPAGQDPFGGNAVYVSGSGSRELVFRHTISDGENIDDLNYRGTDSLAFANDITGGGTGSSLVDGAGNDATLTLPATNSDNSLGANSNIVVDTEAPTATFTGAAYDENTNQLLLRGTAFDELLTSSESTTVDLKGRLDWSKAHH